MGGELGLKRASQPGSQLYLLKKNHCLITQLSCPVQVGIDLERLFLPQALALLPLNAIVLPVGGHYSLMEWELYPHASVQRCQNHPVLWVRSCPLGFLVGHIHWAEDGGKGVGVCLL